MRFIEKNTAETTQQDSVSTMASNMASKRSMLTLLLAGSLNAGCLGPEPGDILIQELSRNPEQNAGKRYYARYYLKEKELGVDPMKTARKVAPKWIEEINRKEGTSFVFDPDSIQVVHSNIHSSLFFRNFVGVEIRLPEEESR